MTQAFRLFWLRESGSDAGTLVSLGGLDPALAARVSALADEVPGDGKEIEIHLPFFDRRQWRRRAELLGQLNLIREGSAIRCVLDPAAQARTRAATLALCDPVWRSAPDEWNPSYFPTWQRVSLRLQRSLRVGIPEIYFRDLDRYEDRDAAYPFLVYQASRMCYGRPRTEFTHDVADPETLDSALRMIGRALQTTLAAVESRLHEAGSPALARRYAPVWHHDILRAVQERPRKLMDLLAVDAVVVNAVIDLGTARSPDAVGIFSRSASAALRSVAGAEMRELAVKLLDEATKELGRTQITQSSGVDGRTA